MVSSITNISNSIDINFPRPGEAISTIEEFQSNFKKIYNSFEILSKESTLLSNLSIDTISTNDFNENFIIRGMLANRSEKFNDLGVISNGIIELNVREGSYHKCLINTGYYTFNTTNWQSENIYNQIRLEITNQSSSTTATCQIGFSGKVTFTNTQTEYVVIEQSKSIFYDIYTIDQGKNLIISLIGSTNIGIDSSAVTSIPGSPPIITAISPTVFSNISGETITISGNYFTTGTVYLGNSTVASPSISPTSIVFRNPGLPAGYLTVRVTTPIGTTSANVLVVDNIDYGAAAGGK